MTEKTYNGWANYETWAVGMFLDGNYDGEGVYRDVLELARDAGGSVFALERSLENYVRESVEPDGYAGLLGDLLGAALSEVDWRELAEAKVAEAAEVGDDA